MIIDTHAHLDQSEFERDLDVVIERATDAGIEAIISIGLDVASSKNTIDIAEKYSSVWAAVGVHPHYASSFSDATLNELRALAHHPKVVAIGETGLDFYRNRSPRNTQIKAFQAQLALAAEVGLPVIVHDRDAHSEVMGIIKEWSQSKPLQRDFLGVLHCFSGDLALAKEAIASGFAISLAGPLTYPSATRLAEVARALPITSLVVETDCPFLPPQPLRGKRNEPAWVCFVVERLAELRLLPMEEVAKATTDNAKRLFGI